MKTKALKTEFNEWITDLELKEKATNTIKQYSNSVKNFFNFLDEAGIKEIDKSIMLDYRKYAKKQKTEKGTVIKTTTLNARIIGLNQFLKDTGHTELTLKTQKINKSNFSETLTETEYKKLLRTAGALGMEREKLLIRTLAETGVRISELKAFTVEALKSNHDTVTVNNKGKERQILVPDKLRRDLLKYAKKNNLASYIFCSYKFNDKMLDNSQISRNLKLIAKEANKAKSTNINLDLVHAHSFRHLYAKQFLYKNGNNIEALDDLANILGHSSIETTRIYTQKSIKEQKRKINNLYD